MPEETDKISPSLPNETAENASDGVAKGMRESPENQREVFERINGKTETKSSGDFTAQHPEVVIKNLRTFQGDVAEAMKQQNTSVLSIAMAEQQRQATREMVADETRQSYIPPQSIVERILGAKKQERINIPGPKKPTIRQTIPKATPAIPTTPITEKIIKKDPIKQDAHTSYTSRVVFSQKPENKLGPDFKKNVFTIILSIILILSGIGAVIVLFMLQSNDPAIAPTPTNLQALLSYNKQESILTDNLSREELIQKIDTAKREQALEMNDVLFISLKETVGEGEEPITTQTLFGKLKTQIPPATLRSFNKAFMLGIYNINGNHPFLIVKISSFENAFGGMLLWEKTLNKDLGSLFSARAIPITEFIPTEIASSTNGTAVPSNTTKIVNVDIGINEDFEDITIRNKDARVLKNARGDTILLYSFLDQQTLLITSSEAPLREIINKLNSLKLIR